MKHCYEINHVKLLTWQSIVVGVFFLNTCYLLFSLFEIAQGTVYSGAVEKTRRKQTLEPDLAEDQFLGDSQGISDAGFHQGLV